ncbi:large conductance mechanosensitive channel protein MscL [Sphingomonas morindae]|uniref:Large-conductance mechanosensitive channel n=1 Tax=Sphingomonas morindae TaxID=1541170 RepID=A0ABY4X3C9_9SPHN|nr:large conductance mechanosensitive channel protein MscL [Sphingomonas morindae]USI71397.1 large conductance mechanosensitive channel protein MscL [Sphingomonas morindae]
MLKDFKAFIMRGNVLDLAVAVIIGAAFNKIVTSLTDDVLMPIIGKLCGGLDFSGYFLRLGPVPADYSGSLVDYAALKKAGVPLLGYGAFVTQIVNFVIVAFIIFLLVRGVNKALSFHAQEQAKTPAAPAPDSAEVVLLREIRDSLRQRG